MTKSQIDAIVDEVAKEFSTQIADLQGENVALKENLEIFKEFIDSKGLGKEFWMYYQCVLRNRGMLDADGNFVGKKENSPS